MPDGVVVEPAVRKPLRIRTTLDFVVGAEFLLVRMNVENGMELVFHNGDQLVGGHVEGSKPSRRRRDHLNLHHVAGKAQGGAVVDGIIAQPAVREGCPTVVERLVPEVRIQMVPDYVFDATDRVVVDGEVGRRRYPPPPGKVPQPGRR